jgi:hypothetical protein
MDAICFDVKCPTCGKVCYETTEAFDPVKMATGAMLRFKKKFGPEGYNWSMPFTDYDMAEALTCAECGGSLSPNGFMKIEGLTKDVEVDPHLQSLAFNEMGLPSEETTPDTLVSEEKRRGKKPTLK